MSYHLTASEAEQAVVQDALLHAIGLATTERRTAAKTTAYSTPAGSEVPIEDDVPAMAVAWIQPTGAHDAHALGAVVTHAGKVWLNLTPANVWEPGVSGWREIVAGDAVAAWVQPTGAHDAYALGARVRHGGATWENTGSDANVWEPGVFGWTVVG